MSRLVDKVFGRTLATTDRWLSSLMKELGSNDPELAGRVLRATLHLLRDRLPREEALQLGAELPMLLRGLYLEGWKPSETPRSWRRDDFVAEVRWLALEEASDEAPERAVRAVLRVLEQHVSEGEIADVRGALPRSFASLWDEKPHSRSSEFA